MTDMSHILIFLSTLTLGCLYLIAGATRDDCVCKSCAERREIEWEGRN